MISKQFLPVTIVALRRVIRPLLFAGLIGALAACASITPGDPFEPYNRKVYAFNTVLDDNVLAPTARAYKNYVPYAFRYFANNFFGNLNDVWVGANNLLQGKPTAAFSDWARVLLNSTFGFFGISDPASEMGFEKNREDFGQTLAVWGLPAGPYVVWPLLGPSSIRGTGGLVADWTYDPLSSILTQDLPYWTANVTRLINTRSKLLGSSDLLGAASLDEYSFVRDAYRQRRRNLIYDGDPPPNDN